MVKLSYCNCELTEDPWIFITGRTTDRSVTYYDVKSNEQWIIFGKCNCCGQCEINNHNPNIRWNDGVSVGESGAEYDIAFSTRKDLPVRPQIAQKCDRCVLWGEYL